MNDQLRTAIILVIQNTITLSVAFGLNLTAEQTGSIIAVANSTLTLVMLFWKKGQEHEAANPP